MGDADVPHLPPPKKVSYRNNTVVLTEQPSQREDKVVA